MSVMIDAILLGWDRNLDYTKRLLADVPQDRMAYQPAVNMNHPAWILSHLNLYHACMTGMLLGKPFEDPKEHKFGMKSKPVADASAYLSKAELLSDFERGHADVAAALRSAGQSRLEAATPLERWRTAMPQVGIVLNYLMILHESTHLGQFSVWRRVQGMPSV
ncbi:MAG: DinB family protein [Planctomycetota bacterium]|nr:DinB family protein [Planctomycetota bacterium]